jgi:hypothetical protein
MNDLFDKINGLYAGDIYPNNPTWAAEIISELRKIRVLLENNTTEQQNYNSQNDQFREFVAQFRKKMQPNTNTNHYPEVLVEDRRIGVDFKGLLYDKKTSKLLSRDEAFRIYRLLYSEHRFKKSNDRMTHEIRGDYRERFV